MPVYRFTCNECKYEFESLVPVAQRDVQNCPTCGRESYREGFEGFTTSVPMDLQRTDPYTEKEIDKVIGADASSKHQALSDKLHKKMEGQQIIEIPVKPGEKFNPETIIGSSERKALGKDYEGALKGHKQESHSKGTNPNSWDKSGFRQVNI
jgi:putative FmdB family regulatory protein